LGGKGRTMCPARKYGISTTVRCKVMNRSIVVYPIKHPITTCTAIVFLNSTAYGRHMLNVARESRYQVSPHGVKNDSGPQFGCGV
jgi:hypothetical protein